jgi:asparagine synthase (glutamine-hydrolysing)
MCGIGGLVFDDPSRSADRSMLESMTSIMKHRGPDSDGYHSEPGVGLAMCRLSIIDTESGHQPLANEERSLQLICNGEIYNHIELREQLQGRGHHFRSRSDSEVIVHSYEEEPRSFWQRLRGMFAFALWDSSKRKLILVRDRLGIKPLFFARIKGGLVFGSEMKTVLASGLVPRELDHQALMELFSEGYVSTPHTLIKGVKQLPPGTWMTFQEGRVKTGQYWDLSFPQSSPPAAGWVDDFGGLLEESVRLRLRSDVPLGSWLSAGIDSSAVTALAQRNSSRPLQTFSVGFQCPQTDELRHARLLDEYPDYNLDGHRCQCGPADLELLPEAVWHREQPSSLSVGIARLVVSRLAAQSVKVVLAGEGADELLGGYPWYRANRVLGPLSYLPSVLRRLLGRLLVRHGRWPGAGRILMAPPTMGRERFRALIGRPQWGSLDGLFQHREWKAEERELVVPDAFQTWSHWNQLHYLDFRVRLVESILPGLDRFSMAHSLEARVPFLDHHLVDFCGMMPSGVKMPGLLEKVILRKAMRGRLPEPIRRRRKVAMTGPSRAWMTEPFPEFIEELLIPQRLKATGLFEPSFVEALRSEQRAGRQDHSHLLFLIIGTELWYDQFMKGSRFGECGNGADTDSLSH